MNKPILMCVQPSIRYYAWQVEVMLNNFISLNLQEQFEIHVLFAYNTNEKDHKKKLDEIFLLDNYFETKYPNAVQFYYYEDTRQYPISYISSIRPNLIKQHYKELPYISNTTIFYHDCDIVFTKYPDFILKYAQNDTNWYVSDTKSYIGYDYIISKGQDVIDAMCEIVGISQDLVKQKQNQSGGCQYIIKGVDYDFWDKVEKDAEKLFHDITMLNVKKQQADPTHHELQIWCADMWSVLWNAWLKGFETHIIDEMEFCWATDSTKKWDEVYIFHNAGVTDSLAKDLFYKANYRDKLPYGIEENYKKDTASYKYFEMVKQTGKRTCLATMNKVKEIILSFATAMNPSEEQKEIAEIRLKTCMGCEFWVDAVVSYCSECGCSTKGKVFSPKNLNACPKLKWEV